eukprot:scaffold79385_cov20-Cyclotella_meneghiniana.AAC.2
MAQANQSRNKTAAGALELVSTILNEQWTKETYVPSRFPGIPPDSLTFLSSVSAAVAALSHQDLNHPNLP